MNSTPPLRRNWFHILLALSRGADHGYAVMKDVEEQTAGHLKLWPATLYGALADLSEAELIEEVALPAADQRDRRVYHLTAIGQEQLAAETERLAGLVALSRERQERGA